MRGRRVAAAGITAAIVGTVLGGVPAWASEDGPVQFADSALRACVNATLGQPGTATVSSSQAASIEHLECYSNNITSLAGVEALTNLGSLLLAGNQISDLTPLAGLTSLWYLEADANRIHDFSPLAALPNLLDVLAHGQTAELTIPCGTPTPNPVTALAATVPLTGTGYDTTTDMITTRTGTHTYTWDTDLFNSPDQIGRVTGTLTITCTTTPAPSSGNPTLTPDQPTLLPGATFRPCPTPDLRNPGQRTGNFATHGCPADDSSTQPVHIPDPAFRACINLELGQPADAVIIRGQAASILVLGSCFSKGITSLEGAQALTNATALGLYDNHIQDLTPLAGLIKLQSLSLESNNISDISPLAGLTNLGHVGLHNPDLHRSASRNSVTDLSPLGNIPHLGVPAYHQEAAASVTCGTPYTNPVIARDGTPEPLTGDGYDAASNTIDTTTPGTYQYTWGIARPLAVGYWDHHVGTLTLTITC